MLEVGVGGALQSDCGSMPLGIVVASTRAMLLFTMVLDHWGDVTLPSTDVDAIHLAGGMVARFTFRRFVNARFKSGSRHGEGFVNKHVAGASMQQRTVGYDGLRIRRVHTSIRPQKTRY